MNLPAINPKVINIITKDLYVQQDLRHEADPEYADAPNQMWTILMSLARIFPMVSHTVSESVRDNMKYLFAIYNGFNTSEDRMDFLKDSINPLKDQETLALIEMGLDENDPFIAAQMIRAFTYAINKKLLEIPMFRQTTQEIPDAFSILLPLRKTADGKHTLLPEIIANIPGARESMEFYTREEAVEYLLNNYDRMLDLCDFGEEKPFGSTANPINRPMFYKMSASDNYLS